jgi:hypothetical protein
MIPNIFIGIKFWCTSGEKICMDAMMFLQELFNHLGFSMNFTFIPEQENGASDSVQHVLEEARDLISMNVFVRMKADKEGKPSSFGRNADCRNSGQLFRMGRHRKNWCFSFGRPRFPDIRGKKKAGFIEENQVCPKLFGFFLYGAKHDPSNPEFVVRPFPGLSWQAFGNSNSMPASNARHGSHDTESRKGARWPLQYALASKAPLDNLLPMHPCANIAIIFFFGVGLFFEDGQKLASTSNQPFLFVRRCGAIVRLSLMSNPAIGRPSGSSNRFAGEQWLGAFAILTACLFVLVSCIKINILSVNRCTHSLCEIQ